MRKICLQRQGDRWRGKTIAVQRQKLTECNRMQITLVNLLSDWQLVNFINSTIYFAISHHQTNIENSHILASERERETQAYASTHHTYHIMSILNKISQPIPMYKRK